MKTVSICIAKGGTGKTTTTATLSAAAVKRGYKVLAVDLEPQANLTIMLGGDAVNVPGTFELLEGKANLQDVIQNTPQGVDVIAGNINLQTLKTFPASAQRLYNALQPVKDIYDYVFIDCPPGTGELQFNALYAQDVLIVPLKAEVFSLQGLYNIHELAKQIKGDDLQAFSIITSYSGRSNFNKYMAQTIKDTGKQLNIPLAGTISNSIAVTEAQAFKQSIYEYAPKNKAGADYMRLFRLFVAEDLKKDELTAYITEHGGTVPGKANRQQLLQIAKEI